MVLEHLITELNAKGDYINIGIRGFGNVLIENEHTFSTKILKEKEPEASVVKQKGRTRENIDERELLFDLLRGCFSKSQVKRVEGAHRLLQITAKRSEVIDFIKEKREEKLWERVERYVLPSKLDYVKKEWDKSKDKPSLLKRLAKKNPKFSSLKDLAKWYQKEYHKESFSVVNKIVTGHYTEMARQKLSHPWSYYEIDDKLIKLLETKKEVILPDAKHFKFKRYLNSDELLSKKWCLIDIEKPRFDTEKEEVSWVAITYWQNGVKKKEIHTSKDVGEEFTKKFFEKKNCKIFVYKNENELVRGVNESMNFEKPDDFSSYNTPYDFIELRETDEGLHIGKQGAEPKKEATTNFFQRLNLIDKLIIDPWNYAKIAKRWLPNQKLVMIAQELGHVFEKKISYRVMAELEDIIDGKELRNCNRKTLHVLKDHTGKKLKQLITDETDEKKLKQTCAQIIAYYVYDDTNILPEILFSPQMKRFYKHLDYICEFAGVDIQKASHTTNAINNLQKKTFFETIGTHQDAIYPTTERKINEEALMRAWVNRLKSRLLEKIDNKKRGLFDNVYHLVIPTWPFLRKDLVHFYPEEVRGKVEKFFEYVIEHKDNPEDFYTLSQYADALCKPLAIAWARYKRANETNFKKLKEESVSYEDYDRLGRVMKELISRTYEKQRINKAYITQEIIENCFNFEKYKTEYLMEETIDSDKEYSIEKNIEELHEIIGKNNLDLKNIQNLVNEWLKLRKKWINVLLPYASDPDLIDIQRWQINFEIINEQLKKFGLTPVHKRDHHLYIQGDKEDLEGFLKKIPMINVDTLDSVLVAQDPGGGNKIYYPKHGFYRGIKIQEESSDKKTIYEMRIYDRFLKLLFENKPEKAVEYMRKEWTKIKKQHHLEFEVPNKNLVRQIKSRKRYNAFVIGTDLDGYEIEFCEDSDIETKFDYNLQLSYFVELKSKKGRKKEWRKIYVANIDELNLHYETYIKKIAKQIECLAKPVSQHLGMMPNLEE